MNGRKVIYIDVSKMSEKELCDTLGIEYIPWYKNSLFWLMVLTFSLPSVIMIFNLLWS